MTKRNQGFDLLALRGRVCIVEEEPNFDFPDSQLVTESQLHSDRYLYWLEQFKWPAGVNRKLWEYLYVLNALDHYVGLGPGTRALGFGVGAERITSILAARGCRVVATDYVEAQSSALGWEARSLADLFHPDLCDRETFNRNVEFHHVDMNNVPVNLRGFDCLWSCGSLEHIGGLQNGLDFIEASLACLRPGGFAVHTTEFNLSSDSDTLDSKNLSFYRRKDIIGIAERLLSHGHHLVLNFTRGSRPADFHVDRAPYGYELSLTALHYQYVITSIGLIIRRGAVLDS